jgi:hypothetical protein
VTTVRPPAPWARRERQGTEADANPHFGATG